MAKSRKKKRQYHNSAPQRHQKYDISKTKNPKLEANWLIAMDNARALISRIKDDPNNASKYWKQAGKEVRDLIQRTPDLVKDVVGVVKGVKNIKNKDFVSGFKDVAGNIGDLFDTGKETFKDAWNASKNTLKGVGAFMKNLLPDRRYNDPEWYTNLDMHVQFNLPFGLDDSIPYPVGENYPKAGSTKGTVRPTIAVLNMFYNPLASIVDRNTRLSQELTLLKGVRGLSGLLPYGINELGHYKDLGLLAINEYGRLKFAIRLAKYYQLTKSNMPQSLLREIGFEPYDFLDNVALYVNKLTELHNFISNTMLASGYIVDKVFHSWDGILTDCNDGKISSFYKTNLNITASNELADEPIAFGPTFKTVNSESGQYVQLDKNSGLGKGIKYDAYSNNMNRFIQYITTNELYNVIKGDMIGAFGTSVVFNDPNIGVVTNANQDGIILGYDELYLNAIHNATLTTVGWAAFDDQGSLIGASNTETDMFDQLTPIIGTGNWKYNLSTIDPDQTRVKVLTPGTSGAIPTNITIAPSDGYAGYHGDLAQETQGGIIDTQGVDVSYFGMNEAEQLEMLSLKSIATSGAQLVPIVGEQYAVSIEYDTHDFFVSHITLVVPDITNPIEGATNYVTSAVSNLAIANPYQLLQLQLICQIDMFPILKTALFSANMEELYTSTFGESNIVGVISRTALETSIKYGVYSLHGFNKYVTNSKITDIAETFSITSNKPIKVANKSNRR